MKITLYNKDGSELKSLNCENVDPLCGSFSTIMIKDRTEWAVNDQSEYLYTNLPFVVESNPKVSNYNSNAKEQITLISDNGLKIREWKDVTNVGFLRDVISFRSNDGKWYNVNGNVIVIPMQKEKNED